jgi:hypothetical protein
LLLIQCDFFEEIYDSVYGTVASEIQMKSAKDIDAVKAMISDHPHLMMPKASIEAL